MVIYYYYTLVALAVCHHSHEGRLYERHLHFTSPIPEDATEWQRALLYATRGVEGHR